MIERTLHAAIGIEEQAPRLDELLSPREVDVVTYLALGRSDAEIAEGLGIAKATVKVHVTHILRKLGLTSRHEIGRGAGRVRAVGPGDRDRRPEARPIGSILRRSSPRCRMAATRPNDADDATTRRKRGRLPMQSSPEWEPVVPAQWSGTVRGDALQPERRLMLAVLVDALELIVRARPPRDPRALSDARRWVAGHDRRWPFSFLNVCDALDLDPERLRSRLARMACHRTPMLAGVVSTGAGLPRDASS